MLITSYYLQITSYVSGSYFISSSSLKMLVISSIVFFIFVVNQPGLASLFRLSFSSFSFCLRSFSASLAASLASRSSSSFLSRAMRACSFSSWSFSNISPVLRTSASGLGVAGVQNYRTMLNQEGYLEGKIWEAVIIKEEGVIRAKRIS